MLAVVGVYGVISYAASQRTHEIGIRLALGAQALQILKMILRQGFIIVGAGVLAGILAAAGMARLVANLLFGVPPWRSSDLRNGIGAAGCGGASRLLDPRAPLYARRSPRRPAL